MSEDYYTGLSQTAATTEKTKGFNMTAMNAERMRKVVGLNGARISIIPSLLPPSTLRTFDGTQPYKIPNNTIIFDTDGFVDSVEGRLTIPAGFAYAEVSAYLRYPVGNWRLSIYKNGSAYQDFECDKNTPLNPYAIAMVKTEIMQVTAGDFFEAVLYVNTAGTQTFDQWFKSAYSGSLVTENSTTTGASLALRAFTPSEDTVTFTL